MCVGPVEWNLAPRTVTAERIDAYPGDVDGQRLEDCPRLGDLQIFGALLTDDVQEGAVNDDVVARLRRWLR